VGTRHVSSPGQQTTSYPVSQIAPQLPIGLPIPIPPFSFNQPLQDLGSFNEYEWAFLAWGDAQVTITNNFPFALVGLTIDLNGVDPPLQIAHLVIPDTLDPGDSVHLQVDLPLNVQIDNVMQAQMSGQSPGTQNPVIVEQDDEVRLDVLLNPMGVTRALAHLAAQTFGSDSLYELEEERIVRQASICQGSVTYQMENLTPFISTVIFTLPDFSRDGVTFSDQAALMPNETYAVENRDLSGYVLNRPQGDNMIRAVVTSEILDTGDPLYQLPDSMVLFDSQDLVRTEFHVSRLEFNLFDGVLDSIVIDINQPAEVLEDIPDGMESVQVASAAAELHLMNTVNLPVEFHLTLQGYKDGVVADSLVAPVMILPAAQNGNTGIMNEYVLGLERIINLLPDSIKSVGYALFSGSGTLTEDQHIRGYYNIHSPFAFAVNETDLEPKISKIDESLIDELQQVDLNMTITNAIPLSGTAYIVASYDSSHFRISGAGDVDTLMSVPLPPAQVNGDGYVVVPGTVTVDQTLESQELALFQAAGAQNPLYVRTSVRIHSTEGDTVRCLATDYITVKATAHLILNVNTGY
jgi:hypothetical protein